MSTTLARPGDSVDFALQPYRRRLRTVEIVVLGVAAVAIFAWVAGALFVWVRLGRAVSLAGAGAVVAVALAYWWRADHRRYPAGRLHVGPGGLRVDDGLRVRPLRYDELRFLIGTGMGLVLKGRGRRVMIDWPRFLPLPPRQVVEALLARVAVEEEGPQILQRTAQQARRGAGLGRIIFWVCIGNGALILLRLLLQRGAPAG